MQFLEKLWKIWESIEIWNLPQQKEEETTWCQSYHHTTKFFEEGLLAIEMKKKRDTYEWTCLLRTFNTRIK